MKMFSIHRLRLCLFALVLFGAGAAAWAAEPAQPEQALIAFRNYQILTYVYRPAGASGALPVVLYSHGRSGTAEGRRKVAAPARSVVDYWLARGFAVVAPVRPGYGQTGGGDREIHRSRWVKGADGTAVCEGEGDFLTVAEKAAEASMAVIDWLRTQPWADTQRIVLHGQSVGGLATIAMAGKRIDGVRAAINFAGGTGGEPERSPGHSCMPERLAALYADYGRQQPVPSLWLYSQNDQFWGEQAPKAWYAAFAQGGSDSRFFAAPAITGHDGHQLLLYGSQYWMPEVDAFLSAQHLR